MNKRIANVLQVVVFIMLFALLGGIVYAFLRFSDGGKTDFATFYVEYNGKELLYNQIIGLKEGKEATFTPKYTVETIGNYFGVTKETDNSGYSVQIVPNITNETSFVYTVGDETRRFSSLANKDFCSAFGYTKNSDGSFSLQVAEFSVAEFLSTKYDGKSVEISTELDDTLAYFNLVITSYDGKNVLTFGLIEDTIINFTIDGVSYQAEKDMTLKDWSESSLCEADIDSNGAISVEGKKYYLYDKITAGNVIYSDTILTDGSDYFAVAYSRDFYIIDNTTSYTYYTSQNMTWREWIASEYCTLKEIGIDEDGSIFITTDTGKNFILNVSSAVVKADDVISDLDHDQYYLQTN